DKKIIALVGDFYHPADYYTEGLENILARDFSLDIKSDYNDLDWDKLNDYDLFILASSGKLNPQESDEIWMTEKHEQIIDKFLGDGGSLFVLHSGLAGYKTDGLIRQIFKGHFLQHPEEHPEITVEVVNENHEITNNIDSFKIVDEQYFVDLDQDEVNILLKESTDKYGDAIAAWVHKYKKGTVFSLTPGHTLEVLSNNMMKKLVLNGVNYCLNKCE
ncbi:MAG: ThuA domain-containing protein, partial [bacterium]